MGDEKGKSEEVGSVLFAFAPELRDWPDSEVPVSVPDHKLAKGWQEQTKEEKAKAYADRALFALLNEAVTNWSRTFLYHVVLELARKWVALATLEEVRAMVIDLEEYVP